MKKEPIDPLEPHEFGVVKRIDIYGERNGTDTVIGSVFYKRLITPDYNFAKQKAWDEANPRNWEKLFRPYPFPENFPSDEVDAIILGAIRNIYPNTRVHNELMLFQLTKDQMQRQMDRPSFNAEISLSPYIDAGTRSARSYYVISSPLKIFSLYSSIEELKDITFTTRYDADNSDLVFKLQDVVFY